MSDRFIDEDLVADSLELLAVFRGIDNPSLRRTLISLAYALKQSHYGTGLWSRFRPRRPPAPRTSH